MLLRSCLNISSYTIRVALVNIFLLSAFTSFSQTTSLVVNYDLRGFPNVSYLDSFTMRYTNELDSVWSIEHTFHCPKDFHWSDTLSPIPEGDIQLTIFRDSIKVLESYYWVTANRLNEVDITIERQYNRSKGAPFISEDFIQGYVRSSSNISDWGRSSVPLETYTLSTGFLQGIMVSQRIGFYYGFGLNYEFARFKYPPPNQKQRYNYWSLSAIPAFRFAPFGYEHPSRLKRNVYIDAGASYYLPLKFRQTSKANNIKVQERDLHNFTDVRLQASITIWRYSVFGTYRLTDFVKQELYPELPRLQLGIGITNRL